MNRVSGIDNETLLRTADLAARQEFRLGEALVSPGTRTVRGPGGEADLEPRVMQVLVVLADAAGQVVTRETLFQRCWGNVYVGDDSLNRAVAGVRRIATSIAADSFAVETIPRTGYRLLGKVTAENGGHGLPPADAQDGLPRRAIFAGGGLLVGAAALGTWQFYRSRQDDEVQALVDHADQILRYEYSDRKLEAVPLLEQALRIKPDDSAALGLVAFARSLAATSIRPGTGDIDAADSAIRRAMSVDRNNPNARLALLMFRTDRFDWATTEDGVRSILSSDPGNIFALEQLVFLYQASGRVRLSWDLNEKVIGYDPISPSPQWRKALKYWIYGRPQEADRVLERLVRIWPSHPWVWNARFLIFAFTGRPHAALDMIDDAETRPATITAARMAQWRPTLAALENPGPSNRAAARDANLAAARQSPGQAAYGVMALSALGEIDAAFDVAEGFLLGRGNLVTRTPADKKNALVNNPSWRSTQWISTPPMFEFRAHPRFKALCDGIGLTDYWRLRNIVPDYPPVRIS